ncbi:MAG: M14 family zinc carboxypeptidase [Bacteroidales bacterium]
MNRFLILIPFIAILASATAQQQDGRAIESFFKASGTPVNPKVQISWNRYYTNDGLYDIYQQMVAAHPELISLQSIGKSYEGKDLWLLTVSNLQNKPYKEKPAFWVDGNIHANEIQAAEVSLYTAWYLTENYGKNPFITNLLDDKVLSGRYWVGKVLTMMEMAG